MDTEHYRTKLLAEKEQLEESLRSIGEENRTNPDHFSPVAPGNDGVAAFRDEVADRLEEWDERVAADAELEGRLAQINRALGAIEEGVFGRCRVCGNTIEEDRLNANPAAQTCKEHLNS